MPGQRLGSLIAAVFGAVYVVVNSGPLPDPVSAALRVAAVLGFLAVVVAILRAPSYDGPPGVGFPRAYWVVVVVEFLALFVGSRVVSGPLGHPEAGVAWVSVVVGAHFFLLAVIFRARFFHLLGATITACGLAGLALAFATPGGPDHATGAAAVAVVAGVLPGLVLLAFGAWGARRRPASGPGRYDLGDPAPSDL